MQCGRQALATTLIKLEQVNESLSLTCIVASVADESLCAKIGFAYRTLSTLLQRLLDAFTAAHNDKEKIPASEKEKVKEGEKIIRQSRTRKAFNSPKAVSTSSYLYRLKHIETYRTGGKNFYHRY